MRLLARSLAPVAWRPGWPPAKPAPRCVCGAWVVARSSAFTSCARGCVSLAPRGQICPEVGRDLAVLTGELVKAKEPGRGRKTSQAAKSFPAKTAKRPPRKPKPEPPALTPEQERFRRLLPRLRVMEHGFVQDQRRGRPASAGTVALAVHALQLLRENCPGHGEEIAKALPWLTRKAGRAA